MLSSAILSNIGPQLNKSQDDSNINRAVASSIQTVNPGVSDNQTGMLSNQINPGVSDDQMGSVSVKRAADVSADREGKAIIPSKRPHGPDTFDESAAENDVETVVIDDEFTFPNSRWEASEELSTFLGTTNKRMNKFDRKTLVKSYPRPDVDKVYMPAMDDFLKPFIQGIMAPDKPHKDLQDNILDMFGPLCTIYKNLLAMLDSIGSDGVIQMDKTSVNGFLSCVKGDASAGISVTRRELVLKKINPLMASLAQEHFPDAKRQLFGPGFEQRLKTRSETADTIAKASKELLLEV